MWQDVREDWWDGTSHVYSGDTVSDTGRLSQPAVSVRTTTPREVATAYSAANLPEGTLRVTTSTANSIIPLESPGPTETGARAQARFFDVLTVVGDFSAPVYGTFRIHLDGSMTISQGALYDQRFTPAIQVTRPVAYVGFAFSGTFEGVRYESRMADVAGTRLIDETFEVQVPLHGLPVDASGNRLLSFDAYLNAASVDGGLVDLGNTARIGLEVPQGYSFTSEQGFGTATGVPDSGPGGMLAGGAMLLVTMWNSRSQRHRQMAGTGKSRG